MLRRFCAMLWPLIDARGRDLRPGDWVRVIQAPIAVVGLPAESLDAFSAAIGVTLQIFAVDAFGCLELQLSQKLPRLDTIWIEPHCCLRSRRPSKPGASYRRHIASSG